MVAFSGTGLWAQEGEREPKTAPKTQAGTSARIEWKSDLSQGIKASLAEDKKRHIFALIANDT